LKIKILIIYKLFSFLTEDYSPETAQVLKYLTITPASGELPSAYDRNSQNQTVQVIINTKKEINIKDAPILKCQITEPTATDNPIIANIPIKISVKAVLSR
jgi:hydrocephalus-inducing protein